MTAAEITAAEQIYRQALAALSEGIVVQDKDGAITSWNPAAERILGLSVDQMKGVKWTDPRWRAVHEDGSPFPGEEHPAIVALRTGLPLEGVIMGVYKPDGSLSWISITSMPFRAGSDGAGEDAVVTTFTDITARRSAEAKLRETEERFQAAITTMQDAVAVESPVRDETGEIVDFRYDYANDALCEVVGRDREQLLGRRVGEVFPDWSRSERFEVYRQVMLTGTPFRTEDFHSEQAWGPEFARRALDVVVARAGEQLVVSARDVTDRRRTEAQLRASEERFDAAVGSMLDAFAIISPVRDEQGGIVDFRWEYVNDAYCELVGFDRGQLVGHRLVELLPGFPASERFAVYRRVSETGEPSLTLDVVSPEARAGARVAERMIDTSIVAAGENVVVTARDVTERRRLEEQLRASEELFRTGVGSLLDGFTICSPVRDETGEIIDFRWEYANDAACARNGLTREQMLGHRISEVLPGYTSTNVFKLHRRVAQTGEPARVDEVSWQGEWVAGRQVDRAYDGSVVPLGPNIIVTGRDVTEARRNERKLRLQAELLELAHDAVIVRDPAESRVTFWNREAQAIYGYSRAEAVGQVTHELLATVFPESRQAVDQALARDGHWAGELRHTRKDGGVIGVSSRQALQNDADGRPLAIIELNSDITDRQRAERQRAQVLAELEEAQRIGQMGSWRWDPSAGTRVWSAGMYVVYGRDPAAGPMDTEESFAFVHADDLERVRGAYARMREGGAGFELDYRLLTADGRTRAVHAIARPDPDQPGRYRGTLQDVTERERAEEELRLRAELLDLAHDAVIVRDPAESRVTFWNREAQAIYGYSPAEALDRVLQELLATVFPESRRAVDQALAREGHWAGELRHTRKDGTPIVVSSRQALQRAADGRPLAIIELNSDVTERKRVEEALRASEQRFRGGFENSPIGMALVGLDGRYVEVNATLARMLGFDDPAELAGQSFTNFIHPDEVALAQAAPQRVVETGSERGERRYIRRDGAVVYALYAGTLVRDADGQPLVFFAQLEDITERKLAEAALRASEERFRLGLRTRRSVRRSRAWTAGSLRSTRRSRGCSATTTRPSWRDRASRTLSIPTKWPWDGRRSSKSWSRGVTTGRGATSAGTGLSCTRCTGRRWCATRTGNRRCSSGRWRTSPSESSRRPRCVASTPSLSSACCSGPPSSGLPIRSSKGSRIRWLTTSARQSARSMDSARRCPRVTASSSAIRGGTRSIGSAGRAPGWAS